jgi:hypothetical protein
VGLFVGRGGVVAVDFMVEVVRAAAAALKMKNERLHSAPLVLATMSF